MVAINNVDVSRLYLGNPDLILINRASKKLSFAFFSRAKSGKIRETKKNNKKHSS